MTFLEAAIEILRQAGRPLHVHELTERLIKANLLSHLGRAPETTMQSRLTQELKKGDRTPLVQVGPGTFGLKRYDKPSRSSKPAAAVAPAAPAAGAAAEPATEEAGGKRRRRRRGGRGRGKGGAAEAATASIAVEEGTPEEAIAAERMAEADGEGDAELEAEAQTQAMAAVEAAPEPPPEPAPVPVPAAAPAEDSPPLDLDALRPVTPRIYPRIVGLPDEETLAAQYADELGSGVTAPVEGELVDAQTADEDRPMLAEIQADRDRHGRRRERGRKDRDKKKPGEKKAQAQAQPQHQRAPAPASRAPAPRPHAHAHTHAPAPAPRAPASPPPAPLVPLEPREGGIADAALALLRALNDPRPVHARQLAAMAVKRRILAGDIEDLWRTIRAALAGDARDRQSSGLRPRARHQGGGLFVLATTRLEDDVRAAEEALAHAAETLRVRTQDALRARLAKLPSPSLEQLARLYLERVGFRDVERVKRAGETCYLGATLQRGGRTERVLIGVRAGGGEVNRHAVGELRAGVVAKEAAEGLLLACGRVGADGAQELAAEGPPIRVVSGDELAAALVAYGIGVVRAALPVSYLDLDFIAELGEG